MSKEQRDSDSGRPNIIAGRRLLGDSPAPERATSLTWPDASEPEGTAPTAQDDLEKFARFAISNHPDGAYVITKDARFVYANPAGCAMLGYESAELLEMSMYDINPQLTSEIWYAVWEITRSQRKQTIETEHRTKDGRMLPVEVLANAVELNGVEYSCAFARDITTKRQLEARIRQSEKLEALGQLAGGIAHDFNNQLAGIVGAADLLRDALVATPDLADLARTILAAASRASGLTHQLLAFARRGKLRSVPVNLHAIVREVVAILERSLDKRIETSTELRAEIAFTVGDPNQLQNAVLNLALNARDAMPSGGTLSFSTRVVALDQPPPDASGEPAAPGCYVVVRVADTGVGMDAETRQRMFEPFFTTKEQGKGTGMGLAAVYGTVRNHHGLIQVHSQPGVGTQIDLFFPQATSLEIAAEEDDDPMLDTALSARVLLVEDESVARETTARMLTRLGCRVTAVQSGDEALLRYQGSCTNFDIVILDLVMPNLSGKETFAALRDINPRIAALVVSGHSHEDEVQAVLALGAKGFLQKPFRIAELRAKVVEVLSRSSTDSTRR